MLNLRCEKNDEGILVSYLDPQSQCLSTERSIAIAIDAVALIMLFIMSTIYILCMYDHKISPSNHFAQLNSVFTTSFHTTRILLMILFVAIPKVFFANHKC